MSKFVKTAIAAAMVMGAFASTSSIAAGNNGTARFYGTIEDSPCSIVPDDHKLEVDMGDIGAEKLKNNGETTPKAFEIHLQDCVLTNTQEIAHVVFTGNAPATEDKNFVIYSTDTGAAFENVSLLIGGEHDTVSKNGDVIDEDITPSNTKQTLLFKAWLKGGSAAPTLGAFEANTTFQITYN